MTKVIIVGCGPAGLAAAHAANGLGADIKIIAPKRKTPQRGPLLIQRPIPGINLTHPDGTIHQLVIGGSILDYRYKLYGDVNIGINGDVLKRSYHAWHHGTTYDKLWDLYSQLIEDRMVTDHELFELHNQADLVVSTANAQSLCRGNHDFRSAVVFVTPDKASYPNQPTNTIIFNAGTQHRWVRSSNVFGVEVTEWLARDAPANSIAIVKPINTDCDCYPHVLRTGRFGAWRNETWVDTAYWDTYGALESIGRAHEFKWIR